MNFWRDWRVLTWSALCAGLALVLLTAYMTGLNGTVASSANVDTSRQAASQLDLSIPQGLSAGFEADAVSFWMSQVQAQAAQASQERIALLRSLGRGEEIETDQTRKGFDAVSAAAVAGQQEVTSHPENVASARRDVVMAINDVVAFVNYGTIPAPDAGKNYNTTDKTPPAAPMPTMPTTTLKPQIPSKEKK